MNYPEWVYPLCHCDKSGMLLNVYGSTVPSLIFLIYIAVLLYFSHLYCCVLVTTLFICLIAIGVCVYL